MAGDEHYDVISAYQKSMRGSDTDAALHYLARLLEAGDLPSATRRLMVCACEDVGLAYPQIIPIVKSCVDIALSVGLPEAKIPLADAVILVCTAPKSNSGDAAITAAMADVEKGNFGRIPRQLQNKHFDGEDNQNKGQFYLYPHSYPNHYVEQQYLPDEIKNGEVADTVRTGFMDDYLKNVKRAVSENIPVLGYMHWSLMDNFEWAEGYAPRFGLIHVDYKTQKRTVKNSAWHYKEIIESQGNILP